MKFQIRQRPDETGNDFEIDEVRIIHAKARAQVVTLVVVTWVLVLAAIALLGVYRNEKNEMLLALFFLSNTVSLSLGHYFKPGRS